MLPRRPVPGDARVHDDQHHDRLDDLASSSERFDGELGRLRVVVVTPGGEVWILTNDTDGRGDPSGGDDRIVRVTG